MLRHLFFLLVVRPLLGLIVGINARHRDRLPAHGPAIVVANHNSHLDVLVLMTLFPAWRLGRLRPVGAADYFLRSRPLAWFALNVIGILPLDRRERRRNRDPLTPLVAALDAGEILILFPEGSRGEPERLGDLRTGIAHLAGRRPGVPVIPVFLHGLGKTLPKGSCVPVPFVCDAFVAEPLHWTGDRRTFMAVLDRTMTGLEAGSTVPSWT